MTARHLAGLVAWLAFPADLRPDVVDGARGGHADLAHKGRAAVAMAPHAAPAVIDQIARNAVESGIALQREARPFAGKRTTRTTGLTNGQRVTRPYGYADHVAVASAPIGVERRAMRRRATCSAAWGRFQYAPTRDEGGTPSSPRQMRCRISPMEGRLLQ